MSLLTFTRFRAALLLCLALLLAGCRSPEAQKKRHFDQGNKYAAEKRDDFAVIEYANAVRIDPKFGEARLKLAETYERMGNTQAAFPEFIRAADALPADRDVQIKATQLLIIARRYQDAKARAASLLKTNPADVDALLLSANAMAGLKDPAGATEEIEEALKVASGDSRVFLSLGGIQMSSGARKAAEESYRRAISLKPSSVEAHLALANFLWSSARHNEAEQELKQSIALDAKNVLANRMLAALYVGTNRRAQAEQPLKVVAEVTKLPTARFDLAEFYLSVGREQDAISILSELAADKATSARAEAGLAAIDYHKGKTKEAHVRLDNLLGRAPKDPAALQLKTQWLTAEHKLDEALDAAKAAVSADPQSATAQYALGLAHSLRGNTQEAIAAYNETLRLNPRFESAKIQLSRVNLLKGDPAAALRYAQEAKQALPESVDARIALVRSQLAVDDLQNAQKELAELLQRFPNLADVHTLNGTLQAMRKNNTAARAAFNRARELSPDHFEALGGLVRLDLVEKRLDDAIKRLEAELAKQPPDTVELLRLAGMVYEQTGQHAKAEQAYLRIISTDPKSQTGYGMLAQLYVKQRRLDDARKQFEVVTKRDPAAVGAKTMIGIILEAQGKREEAKKAYEATIADVSAAPVAANNLAFLYAEDGQNLDTALQLASTAKKLLPESSEVDDTLGWIYYKKNLASLAIPPLQESLKKRPNNPGVLYHLGMTYAKVGDKVKSRDALERALKLNPNAAYAASARQTLSTVTQ
jgi:putative PEP-CTERM system TPR-repeat lipoprotein